MTEEQIKKKNTITFIILTIVWFGFFFHNYMTISREYESLKEISNMTFYDDAKILNAQSNIIANQLIIITNEEKILFHFNK